jgi:hypothetical protein
MENNTNTISDSGMTVTAEQVDIRAEQVAGRDIYNEHNEYYEQEVRGFAEINLEPYSTAFYVVPQFTGRLVEQLLSVRLLLITGSYGFDKDTFARHLAWCISDGKLKAREWNIPTDDLSLAKELLKAEQPGIFIVNQVSPKEIDFDLEKIRKAAEQMGHYVLLTSDVAVNIWQQPEHMLKKYWFGIPDHDLYSSEVLQQIFIEELEKNRHNLSFETSFDQVEPGIALTSKHTVSGLSQRFKTPDQVVYFTDMLCARDGVLSARVLDEVLSAFSDTREPMVSKWFRSLDRNEKVIALGASLFEGLYEDQFFGVMHLVTEEFWHFRSPGLKSLDYDDLEFLMNFFKLEEYNASISVFKGKFPGQRTDIVKAAWNTHRRHIMAALPVLVGIGRTSTARSKRTGIYSSTERRMVVRSIIAELLSDIGMIAIQLVEERLLEFAVENEETLQRVTAKAMARWRAYGKERLLFEVLDRWQNEEIMPARIADSMPVNKVGYNRTGAMIYLWKTIVMTLKYASEYDTANNLHPEILYQLTQMASRQRSVLDTALGKVLPGIISRHFTQLKGTLPKDFMIYPGLEQAVISGLCDAYRNDPVEVRAEVDVWLSECMEQASADNRRNKLTQRDEVLVRLLRLFQQLEYTIPEHPITIPFVWEQLQSLYKQELRQSVREVLLETIGKFISLDPEYALTQMERLFEYSGLSEREQILSGLVDIYKQQRLNLPDTDFSVQVQGVSYPSFINKVRPLTAIEVSLYRWLNGNNAFAQSLALLSFMQFSKGFDLEENHAVPQFTGKREPSQQAASENGETNTRTIIPGRAPVTLYTLELSWMHRLRIWWWLLFENEEDRILFRNLLSSTLQHYTWFNHMHVRLVISKLKGQDIERFNKVGRWMDKWYSRIIR